MTCSVVVNVGTGFYSNSVQFWEIFPLEAGLQWTFQLSAATVGLLLLVDMMSYLSTFTSCVCVSMCLCVSMLVSWRWHVKKRERFGIVYWRVQFSGGWVYETTGGLFRILRKSKWPSFCDSHTTSRIISSSAVIIIVKGFQAIYHAVSYAVTLYLDFATFVYVIVYMHQLE